MSIYDRDYYRDDDDDKRSISPFGNMSVVFLLIMANIILYLADMFLFPSRHNLTYLLAMHDWTIIRPLYWFEFLTYGFVHDPNGFYHIAGNMLVLFFFGPWIERKYGKLEFFLFYMTAVLVGGLVWGGIHGSGFLLGGSQKIQNIPMLGASGAICGVVILFACNFPKAQVFLFGILPMPAWVCGVMYVLFDAFGAANGAGNVAHEVHLAGAAMAFLYYVSRFQFTGIVKNLKKRRRVKKNSSSSAAAYKFTAGTERPTYQWNTPNNAPVSDAELEGEVNRILRKIKATGEASLTDKERETLMYASREYQKRKKR